VFVCLYGEATTTSKMGWEGTCPAFVGASDALLLLSRDKVSSGDTVLGQL
jgi:hypothetical protein